MRHVRAVFFGGPWHGQERRMPIVNPTLHLPVEVITADVSLNPDVITRVPVYRRTVSELPDDVDWVYIYIPPTDDDPVVPEGFWNGLTE